jgi:hypothetical protein
MKLTLRSWAVYRKGRAGSECFWHAAYLRALGEKMIKIKLNKCLLFVLFFSFCIVSTSLWAKDSEKLDISYKTLSKGQLLIRDRTDRLYSAVIHDKEGLKEFLNAYDIEIPTPNNLFEENIILVGFTDNYWSVSVDGLKHIQYKDNRYLYMDLHDDMVKINVCRISEDKKYSAWVAISIKNNIKISHVQIREGAKNGLCLQFKNKKN